MLDRSQTQARAPAGRLSGEKTQNIPGGRACLDQGIDQRLRADGQSSRSDHSSQVSPAPSIIGVRRLLNLCAIPPVNSPIVPSLRFTARSFSTPRFPVTLEIMADRQAEHRNHTWRGAILFRQKPSAVKIKHPGRCQHGFKMKTPKKS